MLPSLDVVIPIFNEEDCLLELFRRLEKLDSILAGQVQTRYILVNDGSKDRSLNILREEASRWSSLVVIHLSRNFGHQLALTAGLDYSTADFVASIDADLQDPPECIAEMFEVIKQGYDVVYAVRNHREGETWFKLYTARVFYWLINKLCQVEIPEDAGDFRLMGRNAVDALKSMRESHRFIRGLIPWSGFRSTTFYYSRDARYAGVTKYPLKKMFRFAFDAIFSFSTTPLKIMRYFGFFVTSCGVLGALWVLYLKLIKNEILPGLSVTLLSVIILGGVQILSLGILGEYIGRIFEESKKRPLYIVQEIIKQDSKPQS